MEIRVLMVAALIVLSGCTGGNQDTAHFATPQNTPKNIAIERIHLDSIVISDISSSYIGFVRVFGDSLYFMDQRFSWLFAMDRDGKNIKRHLGLGQGPEEIATGSVLDLCMLPSGDFFFVGPSWDIYTYSPNWHIKRAKRNIDWRVTDSREEMTANPQAHMPGLYSIAYEGNVRFHHFNGHVLMPIRSQHHTFNGFTSDDYYSNGRIIAALNPETGVVEELIGRRSPMYKNYKYIGQFAYINFDASSAELYINHEPDSTIYVYDTEMKPLRAFGHAGRDMDTQYTQIASLEQAGQFAFADRQTKGYYTSIKYVETTSTLLRTYQKGNHATTDGLQIYRNDVLIADLDVPKGFRVEGYIAPYYYSYKAQDENNPHTKNEITIYKFKIE